MTSPQSPQPPEIELPVTDANSGSTSASGGAPLLQHEPVLDRHKAMLATRLHLHASQCGDAVAELNRLTPEWPTRRLTLLDLGTADADESLLAWDMPANVMLEIPAAQLSSPAMRMLRNQFSARKVPLCLNGFSGTQMAAQNGFRYLLTDFAAEPVALCAERQLADTLVDPADYDAAVAAGYAGACGWCFLQGRPLPTGQLNPGHANIIHLLNLVRSNAEIAEIEASFKQDVSLAFKLLRYINSAGFGLRTEIGSFRQAVTLMGYDKLNRWLSLLLVNAGNDPTAPALMHAAVTRARCMELLGTVALGRTQADNLFITGAFSLLDVMLGTGFEVLLQHLKLPAEIGEALLTRSGPLAAYLQLAEACEQGSADNLRQQLVRLGLGAGQCNSAQIEALAFADKLQFD